MSDGEMQRGVGAEDIEAAYRLWQAAKHSVVTAARSLVENPSAGTAELAACVAAELSAQEAFVRVVRGER